jgi:hypothetical protein
MEVPVAMEARVAVQELAVGALPERARSMRLAS